MKRVNRRRLTLRAEILRDLDLRDVAGAVIFTGGERRTCPCGNTGTNSVDPDECGSMDHGYCTPADSNNVYCNSGPMVCPP